MLASRFMKALPPDHKPTGFVARLIESYARGLDWALAHQRLMLAGFGVTLMVAVLAYVAIPKGFFPLQDTAFVVASTQAADDVSYDDMKRKHEALAKILEADPAVQSYAHAIGAGFASQGLSSGRFWISLKDRSDRDVSAEGFINRIRPQMAQVPGVRTLMRSSQDINLGGGGGSAQYLYVLSSADSELLSQWSVRLTEAMEKMPMLRATSCWAPVSPGSTSTARLPRALASPRRISISCCTTPLASVRSANTRPRSTSTRWCSKSTSARAA
jgi:HAE1 family hydrophobic/amphiphilic exporter-1